MSRIRARPTFRRTSKSCVVIFPRPTHRRMPERHRQRVPRVDGAARGGRASDPRIAAHARRLSSRRSTRSATVGLVQLDALTGAVSFVCPRHFFEQVIRCVVALAVTGPTFDECRSVFGRLPFGLSLQCLLTWRFHIAYGNGGGSVPVQPLLHQTPWTKGPAPSATHRYVLTGFDSRPRNNTNFIWTKRVTCFRRPLAGTSSAYLPGRPSMLMLQLVTIGSGMIASIKVGIASARCVRLSSFSRATGFDLLAIDVGHSSVQRTSIFRRPESRLQSYLPRFER